MAELDSHILRDIPFTVIWSKYIYLKYFILRKTLYLIIKTMGQLEVELAKLHFGTIFVLRYEK